MIYDGTIQAPQIIDLQKVAVVYETDLATSAVNGVPTKAALPSPSLDTVGGSGSNEYTIKVAGTYFASVSIATAAATGSKSFGIYKNGVAIHNGGGEAGIYQVMNGGVLLPNLIVGDVISIYFINSSGTTENWVINNFSMFKL